LEQRVVGDREALARIYPASLSVDCEMARHERSRERERIRLFMRMKEDMIREMGDNIQWLEKLNNLINKQT